MTFLNASSWGYGTHINYGVTMTRTTIGHHTTISPGVTICGDVTIGDRTLIGAGAVVCDRVTIGNDVTIGAGAVVLPETTVPDGETWYGVPAKRKVQMGEMVYWSRFTAGAPNLQQGSGLGCWYQFNFGGVCSGDHSEGFHSYNGAPIRDAPVRPR